jgi:GNAT superfamily N-acetyltransferase
MAVTFEWRGTFTDAEVSGLHAQAFGSRSFDAPRDWNQRLLAHSLGWVVARDDDDLVGFVNVVWDGLTHAWLQDTMVAERARGIGIGKRLVALARDQSRHAGCAWLHVDYEDHLRHFYEAACGFTPTNAGLIALA